MNKPPAIGRKDNNRSKKPKQENKGPKKKSVPNEVKDLLRFLELVTNDYPEFSEKIVLN